MAVVPDYESAIGGAGPVPTPSYRRPFFDRSGEIIAAGGEQLGRGLDELGNEMYRRGELLARAQASNALLDHEIGVRNITEDIRQRVASGDLTWDQAQGEYEKQTTILQANTPAIKNLDAVGQENFDRGMKRNVMGGSAQVLGIARAGQKQAFADQYDQALDKLGKLAGMPGADVEGINEQARGYRPMALAAGINAADFDKRQQAFENQTYFNQATQLSIAATNNIAALKKVQHELTADDGYYVGKLDTAHRDILMRTVTGEIDRLELRAEHEQDRREAKAQHVIGQIDEQIASTVPATPDMWADWQNKVKGTSYEQDFNDRLKDEQTVQDVLRKPINEQIDFIQGREKDLMENGGTLRQHAALMRLETAVHQNVNLMQRAPLLYAQERTGVEVKPLDFDSLATPDGQQQFGAQIADRVATLKSMRSQFGNAIAPMPLLPQEAGQLATMLDSATPLQRAERLAVLRSSINDDHAYMAAMEQVAPHSPVTAIAGQIIGNKAPSATPSWFDRNYTGDPRDVRYILAGEQLLNPNWAKENPKLPGGVGQAPETEGGKGGMRGGFPMPADTDSQNAVGLRTYFQKYAADIFRNRPELANDYFATFKAAYAGLSQEKGDVSGKINTNRVDQALKIALGNHADIGPQRFAVPAGMDPTEFKSYVDQAVAATAASMKLPGDWRDQLAGYGLEEIGPVGSGRYKMTIGNKDAAFNGKQVFIDLRDQYLGARGLHRGEPDFTVASGAGQGGAGALGK